MSEGGYTLAETLAALLIIGLAFAGLTEGMRVIGMVQTATASTTRDASALWVTQDALNRLVDHKGPFRSDDRKGLVGDAAGFHFDCGQARTCGARIAADVNGARLLLNGDDGAVTDIALPHISAAGFSYGDATTVNGAWPPAPGQRRLLRSILLVGRVASGDVPLATARLWREQEVGCQFDPIAQDCRAAAP